MKEPKRLLHSEAGLARDVVQAAALQGAPEAALERALLLVDLALAEKGSGSQQRAAPWRPSRSAAVPREDWKRRFPLPVWLRFGLAFEVSMLVPIGAAMAIGIGGTVLVTQLIQYAKSPASQHSAMAPRAAGPRPILPSAAAPRPALDAPRPSLTEPGPRFAESSATVPYTKSSWDERAAAPATPAASPARASANAPVLEGDWLGEQFSLLGKARRDLERGNPAEALQALDDYERRFPEGTLGHQAAALRERARTPKANAARASTSEANTSIADEAPPGDSFGFGI